MQSSVSIHKPTVCHPPVCLSLPKRVSHVHTEHVGVAVYALVFSHSSLLTPKQCVACVSRRMLTNRSADWQTHISILDTQNKQQSAHLQHTHNVSVLFARQMHSPSHPGRRGFLLRQKQTL